VTMRRIVWLGLVLAACDAPPMVNPPQSFRVSTDVWSGGELTLTSAGFATAGLVPDVQLDGRSLIVRRVDDTTVVATLPDSPGQHTLRLLARDVDRKAIALQLRGFLDRTAGPLISGRAEPGRDSRYLFGSGPTSLRRWNIVTNKAIEYADSVHAVSCARGVGPGPNAGELALLTGGCATGRWMSWRTEPLAPLADTTPNATDHFVAVLGAGRWIVVSASFFSLQACDAGSCTSDSISGTERSDVVRSPRGDRAVLLAQAIGDPQTPGVPVVDIALGKVGYRIRALRAAQGAAFSANGDTLYLAGDSATAFTLLAVRASDGATLASRRLVYGPCAVSADPSRPWLFVAGVVANPSPPHSFLQVFDRRTMNPLTTLHVMSDTTYGLNFCRIASDPIGRRVYVIDTWAGEHNPAAHAQLYSFETPP